MDIQLFVEQVSWLAKGYLADASRFGVMTWIGSRLGDDVRERWMRTFPLHHPAQHRAEGLLLDVLTRTLEHRAAETRLVDTPTRAVDWAATYTRAAGGTTRPPMPYVARISRATPDRALLGALVAIARGWLAALEWAGADSRSPGASAFRDRARALRSAASLLERHALPATPMDRRVGERLRRCGEAGAKLVDALHELDGLWGAAFSSSTGDVEALRALGASLRAADIANTDTLLELTTAISIARAATQTRCEGEAGGSPWTLSPVRIGHGGKYPPLVLRAGELTCEITKGTPRRPSPRHDEYVADLVSPWLDEVLWGGEKRARHRQPDIVLRFSHAARGDRVVLALGDAKRNAFGEGEDYLRASVDAATVYLMAFGHELGLEVDRSTPDNPILRTRLVPGVTLFCQQGAGRTRESAIDLLSKGPSGVPTVMAFDVAQHFGPCVNGWRSESLSAWFSCLARQAGRELDGSIVGARR